MITRLLEKRAPQPVESASPDFGREFQVHLLSLARHLARPADPLVPGLRAIGVVSARSREGVSTIARELALLIAASEQRAVLLVDANFSFPAVQRAFGLPSGPGLAEVLLAETRAEAAIIDSDVPHLSLLPAGHPGVDPVAAFGSPRLVELMRAWREDYGLVLVDLPPIEEQPAAVRLAGLCDSVVLVVESGRTEAAAAQRAKLALERSGVPLLGCVMNKCCDGAGL